MKMGNDDDSHDESYHNNYYQRLESPCPGLESEQSDEFVGNFQLKEISPRQEQGKYQASMNDDFGHFSGTSSSENDESLDAFFHLSAPMSFYDQGNQDGHDDSHPRPASASSIASSLVQRASSVLQETSFVVQEVIKHGTICGGAVSGEQSNRDSTSPCALFDVTPSFHGRKTRTCKNMSGSSDGGDGMSAVGSCGGDGNDNDDCPLVSTAAIPLRYSQSSPCSQQCFLEDSFDKPTSFKRSISTPPAFLQSRRGSAFGRVTSTSKSSGDSPLLMETHRSLSSAFDPVGVDCQKSSLSCAKKLGNEGSDEGSIAGSVAGSTFSAKAQRKIKERRRNRLGKVAGGVNQKASMNCSAVDKEKTSDCEKDGHSKVVTDCDSLLKSESVQNEPKETSKVSKMQDISQADYQHFDGIESAGGRKVQSKFEVDDENSLTGGMFGQEHSPSTSPVPLPVYHKMDDNTIMPQPRLVLPTASAGVTFGTRSPCSQESSSLSKSTTKSGQSWNTLNHTQATCHSGCNTSISENVCASSNRSVTSSVAEADREVKEANRRQLRRLKMDEHDCTMSIHSMQSSDTTSTNPHAYFALTSNSAHLREGASMPVDRFFARNAVHSRGHASHHLSLGSTTGSSSGSGRPRAMNPKSPANTVSSTSVGHSISSGEDAQPPLIIKAKFGSGKKVGIAPISDDMGYSRLGSDSVIGASSNSSKSSSSKSSSSKTHRKDRTNLYQKMRASTPSPGPLSNSPYTASPVKMPMTPKSPRQFLSTAEHSNLQRPHVRRSLPLYGNQPRSNSNKFHLVSPMPDDDNPRDTLYGSSMLPQHGAFRPMSIYPSVTPERKTEEFLPSRRASA
jgi:hypothetical protein